MRVLDSLSSETIDGVLDDLTATVQLVANLPDKQRTLFFWLMDLLFLAVQYQGVNKMGPENLGI